jgi:transcriptional regulator with XRE-family HTH domain
MVRSPLTPAELERGQRLGALLRQARAERSMLYTALAAEVSPETLRKIESGRVATPAFSTIAAIADVLGLSLDALWAEINQRDVAGEPTKQASDAGLRVLHLSTGFGQPA